MLPLCQKPEPVQCNSVECGAGNVWKGLKNVLPRARCANRRLDGSHVRLTSETKMRGMDPSSRCENWTSQVNEYIFTKKTSNFDRDGSLTEIDGTSKAVIVAQISQSNKKNDRLSNDMASCLDDSGIFTQYISVPLRF
jgi:hypothetical protein